MLISEYQAIKLLNIGYMEIAELRRKGILKSVEPKSIREVGALIAFEEEDVLKLKKEGSIEKAGGMGL